VERDVDQCRNRAGDIHNEATVAAHDESQRFSRLGNVGLEAKTKKQW